MRGNKRRYAAWALFALLSAGSAQPRVPNVVLVMADDLGKGDIGFYHRQRTGEAVSPVPTPNLDRLIGMGMRFTDAHSPAALCAPTRYSMLTGNYPCRNNKPDGVWSVHADPQIGPDSPTIARMARAAGYHTAFFGKWGLGGNWKFRPEEYSKMTGGALSFGFDYSLELPAGIQGPPYALYENRAFYKLNPASALVHIPIEQTGYNLELDGKAVNRHGMGDSFWDPRLIGPTLAQKAVAFIEEHAATQPEDPFFIYYCSQAVHTPHCAADALGGVKIAGTTPGPLGDFIFELDTQVGMIFEALKKTGTLNNTLFIFTSDNGGLPPRWDAALAATGHKSNGNLAGQKGSIAEGGHRIPFVAVWPGRIRPNTECREPITGLDVVATLAAVAGQAVDRAAVRDSVSLLPLFSGEQGLGPRCLIHQSGGIREFALREGKWKLIVDGNALNRPRHELYAFDRANYRSIALYDLEDNLCENPKKNLIEHPEYRDRATAMFETFCELRAGKATAVERAEKGKE